MSIRSSRPVTIVRAMAAEVTHNHLTFMAGSLAFYAFLSLIPLFLLSVIGASVVGGEAFATRITDLFNSTLTASARDLLADALTDTSGQTGASVVGLVTLLWSGLKLFRGLDIAFDAVYGVRKAKSILVQLRDALVVLAAVALAVGAVAFTGAVLAFVPDLPIPYLGRLSPTLLVVPSLLDVEPMGCEVRPFLGVEVGLLEEGRNVFRLKVSGVRVVNLSGVESELLSFLYGTLVRRTNRHGPLGFFLAGSANHAERSVAKLLLAR